MAQGRSQLQKDDSSKPSEATALTVKSPADCFQWLKSCTNFSDDERAVLIALAIVESDCNPLAHRRTTKEDSYGAFQINCKDPAVAAEYKDLIKLSYDGFEDQCSAALKYWNTHTDPYAELNIRFGQWNGGRNISVEKAKELGAKYLLVHERSASDSYESLCKLARVKISAPIKSDIQVPIAQLPKSEVDDTDWIKEFEQKQTGNESHGNFLVTGAVVGSVVLLLVALTLTGVSQSVARVALAKLPSGGMLRTLLEAIAKTGSCVRIKKKHTYCRFENEMGVTKGYQSCIPLYDELALKRRPLLVVENSGRDLLHVTDFDCEGAMFLEFKEYPGDRFYVTKMTGNPHLTVEQWKISLSALPTLSTTDVEPKLVVSLPSQKDLLIEYQSRKYAADLSEVA